ncbi:MAG: DUF2934 domain-containing protein [Acidobacteria bacterium]|nr:DUF2934 domain-containing protein [Acidobacteriota bacterium]MCI0718078.1 DUF2934 domain-containing protein [Acidobacteriota bacterium]
MNNQNPNFPEETELSDTALLRRLIARRAYQLYEARGCLDGFDLQDWLQAQREILGQVEPPEQAAAVGR